MGAVWSKRNWQIYIYIDIKAGYVFETAYFGKKTSPYIQINTVDCLGEIWNGELKLEMWLTDWRSFCVFCCQILWQCLVSLWQMFYRCQDLCVLCVEVGAFSSVVRKLFFFLMLQPKCVCDSPLASSCPSLSLCVLLGCSSFCGRKKKKKEKLEQCCGNLYLVRLYSSGWKQLLQKPKETKEGQKATCTIEILVC